MSEPTPNEPNTPPNEPPTTFTMRLGKRKRTVASTILLVLAIAFLIPPVRRTVLRWFGAEERIVAMLDKEAIEFLEQLVESEMGGQPLPGMKPITNLVIVPTGLTNTQMRETWHRTPEGSDVFPVAIFRALTDPATGRPFIESMDRFGLIPSPDDNTGLPIGFSRIKSEKHDFVLTGINCSTCHSTQITYGGKTLHIDGAPNMIDVEAFFRAVLGAVEALLVKDAGEERAKFLFRFVYFNFLELNQLQKAGPSSPLSASGEAARPPEKSPQEKHDHTLAFLKERVLGAMRIIESFTNQTAGGPGRADSFGIIRNLMMTEELLGASGNFRPMTAPVSIPHLFQFGSFTNLHWDGNTTTGNDRNYAQAIALGADFDPESKASSARPYGLWAMESTGQKLTPPKWPEDVFGPLDAAKVARGAELFRSQSCVKCHDGETWTRLEVIGTDPNRLTNYNDPVNIRGGLTESYATNLYKSAVAVKLKAYKDNAVPPEDQKKMDTWHERVTPEWISTLDKGYFTRRLRGLWATAPFLHNGSVPTLWDLLQPPEKRPKKFPVGHREFDPVHVGFVDKPAKVIWELDTSISGNRNIGHEFGTRLTDDQKWDLVEYLKTL